MTENVMFKGHPFPLSGIPIKKGKTAPDCELTGVGLKPVKLSSFKGKTILLLTVPSLDTEVCSRETKRFSEEIAKFTDTVTVICVSMDLPFAQSRWCGSEGVKNVIALSDFRKHELGEKFGLLIPDLGLLARAVFILGPDMKILEEFMVKEVTEEPDYSEIIALLSQTLSNSK